MKIAFKEPWIAVGEFAANLVEELRREVTECHPLWKKKVRAIAQRTDTDDVLYAVELNGGAQGFAVVHLTWATTPEPDPRWPETEFYDSIEDWARNQM